MMAWIMRVTAVSESRPVQGPRVELGTVTQGSCDALATVIAAAGAADGLRTGQEPGTLAVAIVRVISGSRGGRSPSMFMQSAPRRVARCRNPPLRTVS
jgi:hypothetical protein